MDTHENSTLPFQEIDVDITNTEYGDLEYRAVSPPLYPVSPPQSPPGAPRAVRNSMATVREALERRNGETPDFDVPRISLPRSLTQVFDRTGFSRGEEAEGELFDNIDQEYSMQRGLFNLTIRSVDEAQNLHPASWRSELINRIYDREDPPYQQPSYFFDKENVIRESEWMKDTDQLCKLDNVVRADADKYLPSMICPITLDPFKNPVVGSDGVSFERVAIRKWILGGDMRSPVTRQFLDVDKFYANITLRKTIDEFTEKLQLIGAHPNNTESQ